MSVSTLVFSQFSSMFKICCEVRFSLVEFYFYFFIFFFTFSGNSSFMKTCCSTLQCFWSLRLVHVASICALAKMRISYFVSSKYDCVTFISQAASKYK